MKKYIFIFTLLVNWNCRAQDTSFRKNGDTVIVKAVPYTTYTRTVKVYKPPVVPAVNLWSAGMETGDLREWYSPCTVENENQINASCPAGDGGAEYNSGGGNSIASRDYARTGVWSMKQTIAGIGDGTRLFRWNETKVNQELYFSNWFYIPKRYVLGAEGWSNIWQIKSQVKIPPVKNDPFFNIGFINSPNPGAMRLSLKWWGNHVPVIEGPKAGQSGASVNWSAPIDIPIGRWFNLEVRHVCAGDFTGAIQVWQDGVEIFKQDNVRTRFPNGDCVWSLNNYGDKITPSPVVTYVDDVVISKTRISSK